MRNINKAISLISAIWLIWLPCQYFVKSQTANMLLKQKIKEFKLTDFDILLQKMGKGYEYKEIEINAKRFYMGWLITQTGSLSKSKFMTFHIGKPRSEAFQKARLKDINKIEIYVYVDYINLLPFGYCKTGPSYILTIEKMAAFKDND